MTSEEDILKARINKKMTNSPNSSGGEDEYDDSSYGSDFQPSDVEPGLVVVHEKCCRARYRKSRAGPNDPFLICLNKSTCRSLAGGNHAVLRGGQRAEPGTYVGIFSRNGKLLAAKSGTRSTPENLKATVESIRESDRAQAAAIDGLTAEGFDGGLLGSKLSIQQAENLVTESDQEVGGDVSGISAGNPSGNHAMFLDVLSSLVSRIEKLDDRLTKTDMANTTILREMKTKRDEEAEMTKGILKDSKWDTRSRAREQEAVSSVASRHATATRTPDASEFD